MEEAPRPTAADAEGTRPDEIRDGQEASMKHSIEADPKHGFLVVTTRGRATAEGFARMSRDLWAHSSWQEGMNLLLDHRPLDSTGLTSKEIRLISMTRPEPAGPSPFRRIATVVETDLGFGLTRMWDFYTDRDETREHRIFRSMEEAKGWLKESPPPAPEERK